MRGSAPGEGRRAVVAADWCVDALPLPITIEEPGSERPVLLFVMEGGFVIHQDLVGRLEGGAAAVASALADIVAAAASSVDGYPATVIVRHTEVAEALGPHLAPRGVEVRTESWVPELEEFARGFIESLGAFGHWPPVGKSDVWRGWRLPGSVVSEFFDAAAAYYEAAPWLAVENLQAPRCVLPSGRAWTVCVLGNGGDVFGLALYSDPDDLFAWAGLADPESAFQGHAGRMVSVAFDRVADLPRDARTELAAARWRVAGPAAYPSLMTINTPGGGVSPDDARDLSLLLGAVPRFVARFGDELQMEMATGLPCDALEWTDPESGVAFRYEGRAEGADDAVDGLSGLPDELREEIERVLDEVAHELGPAADSDEFLARVNERLGITRARVNDVPQEEFGGLTPAQVHGLLSADWKDEDGVVRLRRDLAESQLCHSTAYVGTRVLLDLAMERGGLERTQAGNLKVAIVREWVERLAVRLEDWVDTPARLGGRVREEDFWPLHELRLLADVAGLVRARKSRFELTRKGRALTDPAAAGSLHALLFETCFRRFNIGYGTADDWPELQHQIAFTLCRLSEMARSWVAPEDLLDGAVVPYARERVPTRRAFDMGTWLFESQVLRRLRRFGLLEDRSGGAPRSTAYRVTPLYDRFLEFDV